MAEISSKQKVNILGIGFDTYNVKEAADFAFEKIKTAPCMVATPNPEIVYRAVRNKEAGDALKSADLVLPDGIGIIKAAATLELPLKERVTGMDFSKEVLERSAKEGVPVFLFGSKPGVASKAAEELSRTFSGLKVVGTCNGYYDDESKVVADIIQSGAKVLFVCLGSPKQEIFMQQHKNELGNMIMMGLGGALDVYSGTVKRAPDFFQKHGIEWMYRLFKEPKRAGRFAKSLKFLKLVNAEKKSQRRKKN